MIMIIMIISDHRALPLPGAAGAVARAGPHRSDRPGGPGQGWSELGHDAPGHRSLRVGVRRGRHGYRGTGRRARLEPPSPIMI